MTSVYKEPQLGASLLLAFTADDTSSTSRRSILVIGQGKIAAARTLSCLEAGYRIVLAQDTTKVLDKELAYRIEKQQITSLSWPSCGDDAQCLPKLFAANPQLLQDICFVLVTDTLKTANAIQPPRSSTSVLALRQYCFQHRIPINVADMPALSDFTFPATHRFELSDSKKGSPLQLAITTNSSSCRLASRIRRVCVAALPKSIGSAVARVRDLRELVKTTTTSEEVMPEGDEDEGLGSTLNKPVMQRSQSAPYWQKLTRQDSFQKDHVHVSSPLMPQPLITPPPSPHITSTSMSFSDLHVGAIQLDTLSRMRFVSQISEYWPIERIANLSNTEAIKLLEIESQSLASLGNNTQHSTSLPLQEDSASRPISTSDKPSSDSSANGLSGQDTSEPAISRHDLTVTAPAPSDSDKKGSIVLIGSGPGSPDLLTRAAYSFLTQRATLILSDKLVPTEVLALVPPHIPLVIAKKFPGNAEGAQSELMELAIQGAEKGETVVRLKQGDVYLYGRGGEEVLYFRERGFEPLVLPGLSSVLAGPTMVGIPVTQRGVAETVVVCTGVGRGGKGVQMPGYERSRTTVVLMGVARLAGVVHALTSAEGSEGHGREGGRREGPAYPPHLPIAIIERASSKDQRLVASTLDGIVDAMERCGEQRPPGMMVIGWSVLSLRGQGDVSVLDGVADLSSEELVEVDKRRVQRWLGGHGYIEEDGLPQGWEVFQQ